MSDAGRRHGDDRISIRFPPKPREAYWVRMAEGSREPEFTGNHPGIVLSGSGGLRPGFDFVTFVPLTSRAPRLTDRTGRPPPYIHRLSANPNPRDDRPVWAVCSHVTTVRLSRLSRYLAKGEDGRMFPVVPKISKEDFDAVLDAVASRMTTLRDRFRETHEAEMAALRQAHAAEMEGMRRRLAEETRRRIRGHVETRRDESDGRRGPSVMRM